MKCKLTEAEFHTYEAGVKGGGRLHIARTWGTRALVTERLTVQHPKETREPSV